jgi:hypothetical protein
MGQILFPSSDLVLAGDPVLRPKQSDPGRLDGIRPFPDRMDGIRSFPDRTAGS